MAAGSNTVFVCQLTWGFAPQPIGLVRLTGAAGSPRNRRFRGVAVNPPLRTAHSRRFAAHCAYAQCLDRLQQLVLYLICAGVSGLNTLDDYCVVQSDRYLQLSRNIFVRVLLLVHRLYTTIPSFNSAKYL